MSDQVALFEALSAFTRTLVNRYAVADALFQLSDHAASTLHLAGAGVSFADDRGTLRFATATSAALVVVEREQETLQEGPCVDAFERRAIVRAPDLAAESRWPHLHPTLDRVGFRSAAAVPLCSGATCIGSLDLYDVRPRPWTADDLRAARLLADMATSYVLNASELQRVERTRAQLQWALDSRIVIEQAKGMTANANDVSVDRAFDLLRQHARSHRERLHDVAQAVVDLTLEVNDIG